MISNTVKFWLLLVFLIPSIICSLFVLYYLLFNRNLRHGLNNHIILVVLIIGLVYDVTLFPWMIHFYRYDNVWHRSPIFCIIWTFLDYGLYITQTLLFAWATIERHILIFHDRWVSTKRKRIFVHYLPIISLLLYGLTFFIVLDFFPPCENLFFDSTGTICVYLCVREIRVLVTWNTIVHEIMPVLIIVIFSMVLLVRIVWQKYRVHQTIQWRKHRKMTIQLLSISFLYLVFYFPLALITLINLCGLPYEISDDVYGYTVFLTYYMMLLLPFVCVTSLPELRTKLISILHLRRRVRRVQPAAWTMRTIKNNRTHIQ